MHVGRIARLFGLDKDREVRDISTVDEYAQFLNQMTYQGLSYGFGGQVIQTLYGRDGQVTERVPNDFVSYAQQIYAGHDVVFSCMSIRMSVFSSIRFQWQRFVDGRQSTMYGTTDLTILEQPWPGGTTQHLLKRMILDADLAGNSYWVRQGDELIRLRPDWVLLILEPVYQTGGTIGLTRPGPNRNVAEAPVIGYRKVGYAYFDGGISSDKIPATFGLTEVAHFAPKPDAVANYRGMSWITPIIPEIINDRLTQRHKRKYLENGATPNLVFALDKSISFDAWKKWKVEIKNEYEGPENAYRKMFLGGGVDVKVVGNSIVEMGFKDLQGKAETRIAAAAETPPILVGLSEGLEAATYSNYQLARRRFADGTIHPLWADAVGALAVLVKRPSGSRLWYDARDVPFLREDEKDAAEIQYRRAATLRSHLDSGFEWNSAVQAVIADDIGLLNHTGLFSVQLQPPGTTADPKPTSTEDSPP